MMEQQCFYGKEGDYGIRSDYENYKSLSIAAESLLMKLILILRNLQKY